MCDASSLFFFIIALAICVLLWFNTNFWMVFNSFVKNAIGLPVVN